MNYTVSQITNTSALLLWIPPIIKGHPPYTFYKLQITDITNNGDKIRVLMYNTTVYHISGLLPNTKYMVSLAAAGIYYTEGGNQAVLNFTTDIGCKLVKFYIENLLYFVVPSLTNIFFLPIDGYLHIAWNVQSGGFESLVIFVTCSVFNNSVILMYNCSTGCTNVTLGPVLAGIPTRCLLTAENQLGRVVNDSINFLSLEGRRLVFIVINYYLQVFHLSLLCHITSRLTQYILKFPHNILELPKILMVPFIF